MRPPSTLKSDFLTYAQAEQMLGSETIRSAYLVDAVTSALHRANEVQNRPYATMLRALFNAVSAHYVTFNLYEGPRSLMVLRYAYDPDRDEGVPHLELLETRVCAAHQWWQPLKPMLDEALARMCEQVWSRVKFEARNG